MDSSAVGGTSLGQLQDLVLEAVLTSTPLPGQDSAMSFPDLAYVTQAEERFVLADGYDGQTERASVINRSTLDQAATSGHQAFLTFMAPNTMNGRTTIRLRLSLAMPDVDDLPLGEIVVTFAEEAGRVTTVAPTHALAY